MVTVHELVESALLTAHHLANLTDSPEVGRARRHLLKAQHSTDRLAKMQYLEEARRSLEIGQTEHPNFAGEFDCALDEIKEAHDSV